MHLRKRPSRVLVPKLCSLHLNWQKKALDENAFIIEHFGFYPFHPTRTKHLPPKKPNKKGSKNPPWSRHTGFPGDLSTALRLLGQRCLDSDLEDLQVKVKRPLRLDVQMGGLNMSNHVGFYQ